MTRTISAFAVLAVVGTFLAIGAGLFDPARLAAAWLATWLAAWSTSMGALAVLFLATLSAATWIAPVRPILLATAGVLPASSLALALVVFDHTDLALGVRSAVVLVGSVVLGEGARRAFAHDERPTAVSAVGIVALVAATTLAAFDWIGALHPRWMSNALGLELVSAGVVSALGVVALAAHRAALGIEHVHTLARAMFVALCAWMYLSFCPFLVVWMSDLPAAVSWYGPRITGAWAWLAIAIVGIRFVAPFMLLLVDPGRRSRSVVALAAVLLLASQPLFLAWWVLPSIAPFRGELRWVDAIPLLSCIGVSVAVGLGRRRGIAPLSPAEAAAAVTYRAR